MKLDAINESDDDFVVLENVLGAEVEAFKKKSESHSKLELRRKIEQILEDRTMERNLGSYNYFEDDFEDDMGSDIEDDYLAFDS